MPHLSVCANCHIDWVIRKTELINLLYQDILACAVFPAQTVVPEARQVLQHLWVLFSAVISSQAGSLRKMSAAADVCTVIKEIKDQMNCMAK